MAFQQPYVPIIKKRGFCPNPVAGNIPMFANGKLNPKVIGTRLYEEFWDEQFDRCINGYTTAGLFIPGRYYFYLNFQLLNGVLGPMYPMYVDLDLEYFRLIDWVKERKKLGVVIPKARRKGLSEDASTVLGHGLRFIEGYRGAVTAGIETYTFGLKNKFGFAQSHFIDEMRLNVLVDNDKSHNIGYERKDPIGGFVDDGYGGRISFETMYDKATKLEGEYFHDVICEESGHYKLLAEVVSSIKPALQFGDENIGTMYIYGCVCAGTKVWDNAGNLINIEDVNPKNGILGFNGTGISKEKITYWQPPKEKPCYRITTFSGRVLECSEDHPILWSNKGYMRGPHKSKIKATKFVETKDLKINDQVAVIESVPLFGNNSVWEPRLTGWLIGDGSYGFDKTPRLSSCDIEINNVLEKNFDIKVEKSHITKEGKEYRETRIKGICKELRTHGIYGQVKLNKRLPINVHSWNKNDICELLGGLFDTDGHVNEYGNNLETITLTASSPNLLFEVKLLLQKIGIHSNISRIKCNISDDRKDKNDCYRMNISGAKDIVKFSQEIRFSINYKQEKLITISNRMPFRNKRVKKGVKGLRFERIINIEFIGNRPVYNLTAGTTNTYIANGIVTHNTGGNILSNSKAFKEFWDQAENFGLERFWIPGNRKHYPFYGNHINEYYTDKDTGEKIDAIPNLRHLEPHERIGCEDIEAAKIQILAKRVYLSKLPNKKRLKEHNQALPLTIEEAFTSGGSNNFDDEKLYAQLFNIEGNESNYIPVILDYVYEIDEDGIKKRKIPLQVEHRPAKKNDPEGEIIWVYQYPRIDMKDLDIGGIDGYNQDQTQSGNSLGAMAVVRQGNKVNLINEGIHDGEYPVCLYYRRPKRKEIFFDTCLKISIWYNLVKNTMCSAEQDFVIDYFLKNGGSKYLSPRPKSFDSPNNEQSHNIGAKMTSHSKPMILGIVQSMILDYVQYWMFPLLIRDCLAYDEECIGTDWDSVDAIALAKMRIEDMKARPRKNNEEIDKTGDVPEWIFDEKGNAILIETQTKTFKKKIKKEVTEGQGGWTSGNNYDKEFIDDKDYDKQKTL
jgi:hypothetical protein